MTIALNEHGTRLREIDGIGAVTAVRLIGRTGVASRFASEHAFATDSDVAPIEIACGEHTRHRLSRAGDRRLNSAIREVHRRLRASLEDLLAIAPADRREPLLRQLRLQQQSAACYFPEPEERHLAEELDESGLGNDDVDGPDQSPTKNGPGRR